MLVSVPAGTLGRIISEESFCTCFVLFARYIDPDYKVEVAVGPAICFFLDVFGATFSFKSCCAWERVSGITRRPSTVSLIKLYESSTTPSNESVLNRCHYHHFMKETLITCSHWLATTRSLTRSCVTHENNVDAAFIVVYWGMTSFIWGICLASNHRVPRMVWVFCTPLDRRQRHSL